MSYIVYDIGIAAVLLFFVWLGYRKGLVLTLCSLLAVFVALIGASFLSNALAEPVAKAIEPIVTSRIHDTVTSYYQRSPAENTSSGRRTGWPSSPWRSCWSRWPSPTATRTPCPSTLWRSGRSGSAICPWRTSPIWRTWPCCSTASRPESRPTPWRPGTAGPSSPRTTT